MILKIDSPCSLRIRPGSADRDSSVVLDLLGGSLWFQRSACPSSLSDGMYKGAEVEVRMSTIRVGDGVRTAFFASRLLSVSK